MGWLQSLLGDGLHRVIASRQDVLHGGDLGKPKRTLVWFSLPKHSPRKDMIPLCKYIREANSKKRNEREKGTLMPNLAMNKCWLEIRRWQTIKTAKCC